MWLRNASWEWFMFFHTNKLHLHWKGLNYCPEALFQTILSLLWYEAVILLHIFTLALLFVGCTLFSGMLIVCISLVNAGGKNIYGSAWHSRQISWGKIWILAFQIYVASTYHFSYEVVVSNTNIQYMTEHWYENIILYQRPKTWKNFKKLNIFALKTYPYPTYTWVRVT